MGRLGVLELQSVPGTRLDEAHVKEISFIDIGSMLQKSYTFRSPTSGITGRSVSEKWLIRNLKGLERGLVNLDPSLLLHTLRSVLSKYQFIYSYGEESCSFLEKWCPVPVFNLQIFRCPPAHVIASEFELGRHCDMCGKIEMPRDLCVHRRVRYLSIWAEENKWSIDMRQIHVRLSTYFDWSCMLEPAHLAEQGFFRIPGSRADIKCFFCGFTVLNVHRDIDVMNDHYEACPRCYTFQA